MSGRAAGPDGLLVVDKGKGSRPMTSSPNCEARVHPQGRSRRHPRPRRDRGAGLRSRTRHASARSPPAGRKGLRGHRSARRHHHARMMPRARCCSPDRPRASPMPAIAAAIAALTGADPTGAQRGQRNQGQRGAGLRAGPRRRGRRTGRPARHRVAFRRVPGATDELDIAVTCSSGTYVRALARDLGEALDCGAHLTALRRTRVGPFTLDARPNPRAAGSTPSNS